MATKKSTESRKESTLGWFIIFLLNIAVFTLAFTNPSWLGGI